MPLPFALDHINLWLLEDGPGWTIVDAGYAMPETKAAWEQIFSRYLGDRPVTRIIVTHFHPDHIGLAGWLVERWQAPLWITEKEWLYARVMSRGSDDFGPLRRDFARRAGLDAASSELFGDREKSYRRGVPTVPPAFRRIADGMTIEIGSREWRVIVGEGHAPELAMLYCAELGVLISGDQVLPRISPNVSVQPHEPAGDRWRNTWLPSSSCVQQRRPKPWCCRRTICRFSDCTYASTNSRRITLQDARSWSPPSTGRAVRSICCRCCFAVRLISIRQRSRLARRWPTCVISKAGAQSTARRGRTGLTTSSEPALDPPQYPSGFIYCHRGLGDFGAALTVWPGHNRAAIQQRRGRIVQPERVGTISGDRGIAWLQWGGTA